MPATMAHHRAQSSGVMNRGRLRSFLQPTTTTRERAKSATPHVPRERARSATTTHHHHREELQPVEMKTKKTAKELWQFARVIKTVVTVSRAARVHSAEQKKPPSNLDDREKMPDLKNLEVVSTKSSETKQTSNAPEFPNETWLVNPDGSFFSIWSMAMLPCMMYALLVTPFETAFVNADCRLFLSNLTVDFYFIADVIVQFNVTWFDWRAGYWITSRKLIAQRYVKGWFFIDVLSCMPFDALFTAKSIANFFIVLFVCDASRGGGQNFAMLSMLKLFRLLKLLRVLRVGRLLMRFAASVNVSFKTQTIVKFACVIIAVTHLFACLIRIIGDTPGCRREYRKMRRMHDDPGEDRPEPNCWLTSVRFYRNGVWFQYVAALDWAIKAMIGGSSSYTFGEHILGFFMMLAGLVLTSYLVGEIANVLGNFDPALNDFRATMDNLNQYLSDQKIHHGLQHQLREYFINSEALFRKAYHKSMLENLSPQLRRSVAQAELGNWVLSLPFLNAALRNAGGLEPGADVLYLPVKEDEVGGLNEDDLLPAQIVAVNPKQLSYTIRYYKVSSKLSPTMAQAFLEINRQYGKVRRKTAKIAEQNESEDDSVSTQSSSMNDEESDMSESDDDDDDGGGTYFDVAKAVRARFSRRKSSVVPGGSKQKPPVTVENNREKRASSSRVPYSFTMIQRDLHKHPELLNAELVEAHQVPHDQIYMPGNSLLCGRLADANREWKHLVAEFSLALTPKMYMMNEYIVRPGSLNTHLFMIMEGTGYQTEYDPHNTMTTTNSSSPKSTWKYLKFLSAKHHDCIGLDVINCLVASPVQCDYTATAIGHVFCNVLTAPKLMDIMSFDTYPRLTAETRKMAGWSILKRGIVRVGTLASQERRVRFRYNQGRRVLQHFYKRVVGRADEREPVNPWSEDFVTSDRITRISKDDDDDVIFAKGDTVEAYFSGKNYRLYRAGVVVGVHSKSKLFKGEAPSSYMVRFIATKARVKHKKSSSAAVDVVDVDATLRKIENNETDLDDGTVIWWDARRKTALVYLHATTQIVKAEKLRPCHKLNSLVRVKQHKQSLVGRICCVFTDGTYRVVYDYEDCRASVVTWLFWRTDHPWIWSEADRAVVSIITSWKKMIRLDLEIHLARLGGKEMTRRRSSQFLLPPSRDDRRASETSRTRYCIDRIGCLEANLDDRINKLEQKLDTLLNTLAPSSSSVVATQHGEPTTERKPSLPPPRSLPPITTTQPTTTESAPSIKDDD